MTASYSASDKLSGVVGMGGLRAGAPARWRRARGDFKGSRRESLRVLFDVMAERQNVTRA
jgi:hypothetical protein